MKIVSAIFKTLFLSLSIVAQMSFAYAQTQGAIIPNGKTTFLDNNGNPLSSGKVFYYIPSTTTPKTTYQDINQTIPNTNPVILDAAGRSPAQIWGAGNYRQIVQDQNSNVIWDVTTSTNGTTGTVTTATGDGDLVGTIKPWAGMTAPNQYQFAFGQQISRTTFSTLFTAITSTQAAFCTNGSSILSGLSDTTNFWIGMKVEVACVSGGSSTIINKSSNTVTLAISANVTQNVNATFFPWGNGNGTTTFTLPDLRGLIPVGNNNMGGVVSGNLTNTYFGSTNPNSIGALGGGQSVTLSATNIPTITSSNVNPITGFANGNGALLTSGTNGSVGDTTVSPSGTTHVPSTTTTFSGISNYTVLAGQAIVTTQGTNATPFGIIPPSKTVNYIIKVTPDANSATANGVTDINGMTGSIGCGANTTCTGNTITFVCPTGTSSTIGCVKPDNSTITISAGILSASGGSSVANVVSFGAVDDCVTDSTSAFQSAINAAAAAGGQGIVFIPPVRSGGCFLVGAINATGLSNFTIQGNGDKSLVEVHGSSPVNHNWFDLSVATNVTLRDFKVAYDGSTVPSTIFMMGMTVSNRPTGIRFYRVNITAHTTNALVYAFGNAANNAQNTGLSCQDSTWTQLHNGASTANPYARNTTIDLDGSNLKGLASDYVSFTSGLQGTLKVDLLNCMFVDFPSGFGSGSRDNNAGAIFNLIGEFNMTSGGFRCVCFTDLVIWGTGGGSSENLIFTGVDWESSDGSSATIEQLILMQNATMGNYTFTQPFWAQPIQSMLVLGDACGANCGGAIRLRITAPDINNSNGATLIGDTNCAGFTTTNPWIAQSYIEAEGFTILSCGVIDSHTSIITPGTITSAGADNSRHQ